MISSFSRSPFLRRMVLPLLRWFNPGDIRLRHHFTRRPFLLHSYRHKGYWFHGRRREALTMDYFRRAIQPGDCVIEIGGHIGYISMYFAHLVGSDGKVVVFEPGRNNLPYIRANVDAIPQISLFDNAISDTDGIADFFEEELTGQNNSLHSDYSVFDKNRKNAFADVEYNRHQVATVRLDTFIAQSGLQPDFVKIDIEGAESLALQGSQKLLANSAPVLMVEVTNCQRKVFDLLHSHGYSLYDDSGNSLTAPEMLDGNVCALHPERHREHLNRLGWTVRRAAA